MTDVPAAELPVANPTESERQVWAAFARGEQVDLRAQDAEADDPRGLKPGMPHAGCGLRWWPRYGWAR